METVRALCGGRAGEPSRGGIVGCRVTGSASPPRVTALLAMLLVLLAVVLGAVPAAAQDGELDGLPLLPRAVSGVEDVSSRSFQIYRIPVAIPVRRLEDKPWGLRITLPVSLGTYELAAATDLGDVVESVRSVAVIPGVELLLPVSERWTIKPFGEAGIADDSRTGETHLLYAAGLRALGAYDARSVDVLVGTAFKYRSTGGTDVVSNWYTTLEVGVSAQLPLGFAIGSREAEGGAYAILRHYPDLELELGDGTRQIAWSSEVGLTFSTEPVLRIWKVKLPWVGLGYRVGDRTRSVRLSFGFPF